jgi:uncharacterized membrane protein
MKLTDAVGIVMGCSFVVLIFFLLMSPQLTLSIFFQVIAFFILLVLAYQVNKNYKQQVCQLNQRLAEQELRYTESG